MADALVWEGAEPSLLDAVAQIDDFPQFLLRALIFRIISHAKLPERPGRWERYRPVVELACGLARD